MSLTLPPCYSVWEDWEKHKQMRPVYHLMLNDKGNASGWTTLHTFDDMEQAHRVKKVVEDVGHANLQALIRLLQ